MNALLSSLSLVHPIVQGPMAGAQDHRLAAAVSAAGALGSLPTATFAIEALAAEIDAFQTLLPAAPLNVNFFCHQQPAIDVIAHNQWLQVLWPHFQRLGLDASTVAPGAGRLPFSADSFALLQRKRPRVVSFHFGLPESRWVQGIKALGMQVWASATTVVEAKWLQAHGADAVIAQGLEAGGHRGHFLSDDLSLQMGTFALLPQVQAAVQVPVIAAGGIASAEGVRAALALGASAAQIGTAFLCCSEALTSPVHRAALASPDARHTQLTGLFTGRPARGIVNKLMRELGPTHAKAPTFPLATAAVAPLRAAAEKLGSSDYSPLWCGQNTSGCAKVPAAELLKRLLA